MKPNIEILQESDTVHCIQVDGRVFGHIEQRRPRLYRATFEQSALFYCVGSLREAERLARQRVKTVLNATDVYLPPIQATSGELGL